MGAPAPTLESSIFVPASTARVWDVVSDVRRVREWSPQVVKTFVWGPTTGLTRDGVGVGAFMTSLNQHGSVRWPTTSRIGLYEPDHAIGWTTLENRSRWSYELVPSGTGTLIIERREQPHGISALSRLVQERGFGSVDGFTEAMRQGIDESLARLKQVIESDR